MKIAVIDGQSFDLALNTDRRAVLSQMYPDLTLEEIEVLDGRAIELNEFEYMRAQRQPIPDWTQHNPLLTRKEQKKQTFTLRCERHGLHEISEAQWMAEMTRCDSGWACHAAPGCPGLTMPVEDEDENLGEDDPANDSPRA